jgi:hypothetical protein
MHSRLSTEAGEHARHPLLRGLPRAQSQSDGDLLERDIGSPGGEEQAGLHLVQLGSGRADQPQPSHHNVSVDALVRRFPRREPHEIAIARRLSRMLPRPLGQLVATDSPEDGAPSSESSGVGVASRSHDSIPGDQRCVVNTALIAW